MKALTLRQPWAWAVVYAGKDIENRQWKTSLRGRVAIHAAKGLTREEYDEGVIFLRRDYNYKKKIPSFENIIRGAIVGTVEIVDCVEESKSKWFWGRYGFVLKRPRPIEPIYCSGRLGFWDVPPAIERKMRKAKRT